MLINWLIGTLQVAESPDQVAERHLGRGCVGAFQSAEWVHALEKEMATHSSILAWKIPWLEEPGRFSPQSLKKSDMTKQLHLRMKNFHLLMKVFLLSMGSTVGLLKCLDYT